MDTATQPKLLLTSVMRPIGPAYGDAESVGYELLHAQVTRAQGMFSPRAVHRHPGAQRRGHDQGPDQALCHSSCPP